jgi:hypothetical protein
VRLLTATAAVLIALALGAPAALASPGTAATLSPGALNFGITEPLLSPASLSTRPPGFGSTAGQAMAVAKATPTMQALHRRQHPLIVQPMIWAGDYWAVNFFYHDHRVAEVDVSSAGKLMHVWTGPLAIAAYARGHYSPTFDSIWVVVPFTVLFLVPFFDPRRLRRLVHLDALVLVSLLGSYWLFDHEHLEAAVWCVYPPLVYLLGRMLWVGLRGRPARGPALGGALRLPSMRVLVAVVLALVGAREALGLTSNIVTDVGYASVIGAHRIAHGLSIYWSGAQHGDTYGPIAYLAYLPFTLLYPWHRTMDYTAAAHAASAAAVAFDLVTIAALILLGTRLRPGAEGRRLGLAFAWAWSACPFTLLGLMMSTNDGLIAMLTVLALVAFSSPAARGALVGLAAAAKFTPAALLPLFASPRERGLKGGLIASGAFAMVVVAAVGLYLPPGGLREFYNETIGFQLTRSDVFSPWALHPGLAPLKDMLEAGAVILAAALAFVPRRRTMVQICALAAAVTIAVQLPAIHWFYYYVIWFVPFVIVAQLAGASEQHDEIEELEPATRDASAPEPALVVA